jgi:opacity protein-like surface antigen
MRIFGIVAITAIIVSGTPTPAVAADAGEYRFAITPVIGYRMGGDFDSETSEGEDSGEEVSLDDDSMLGVILNAPYDGADGDAYTEWEFYYSRQSAGIDRAPATVDPTLELDISHFLLGGTYVGGGERVRPFMSAGIGAAHLSPDKPGYESDTVFAFGIGGGAQLFPANRFGVRLEGRLLGSVIDSDSAIFCASGPAGSGCAFRASGDVLWQWEVFAGVTFRL